jgi:site-specific DNA recombinase
MAAEPGPEFRWGIVTRRSQYNADGTEGSTRRQEHAVLQHITSHDMGRVVAVYKDVASAYKEDAQRPEFEAALLDLQAGRIDGIAVWRIDRLVRRSEQFRRVLDVLEGSGGRLFSLVEGIDTSDPDRRFVNELILDMLTRLAEMEAEGTAQRMMLMHEDRARQGLPLRTQVRPFGHTLDWSALVPHEVELIHEAVRRVLAGESVYTIGRDWHRRGVQTASGKPWHWDSLRGIITSSRMVAMREYGDRLFPYTDVPPILDMETWQAVREALKVRNPRPGKRAMYQLSGIGVCGLCDVPLVSGSDSRQARPTYVCRKRRAYPNACGHVSATRDYVDGCIAEQVSDFLNNRPRVMTLLRQHAKGAELDALHNRQRELNDSLVALDSALNPPPGRPRLPLDRYWAQVDAIEAERAQIQGKLAVTREAALLTETMSVNWTPEVWAEQPLEWRRAVLGFVCERVELHRPTKRGQPGRYGTEFDPERVKVKFAA